MKGTIAALALVASCSCALAQVSDGEIEVAYKFCNRPEHFNAFTLGPGMVRVGTDGYKPEWKEQCEAIDAEYKKRDLARIEQENKELDRLNAIHERLGTGK